MVFRHLFDHLIMFSVFLTTHPVWFLSALRQVQVTLLNSNQRALNIFYFIFLFFQLNVWNTATPSNRLAAQYRERRDCPKRGIREIVLSRVKRLIVILLASAGNDTDAEHPKQLNDGKSQDDQHCITKHILKHLLQFSFTSLCVQKI